MATQTQITLQEYLRSSYEPDREYLSGELVERNVGNNAHSKAQWRLSVIFGRLNQKHPIHGRPELRVQVAEERYRVIDFAVYAGEEPANSFPSSPPLIAAEILSPSDRTADTLQKLQEYHDWGTNHIWLIDPDAQRLYIYEDGTLKNVAKFEIPELNAEISREQVF